MRVLFCADVHIKLGQKNVPKEWVINRFNLFIEQLEDAAKGCDLIIFGGDTFDRVPTLEELELYFLLIYSLRDVDVIIYDGNHEATKKGQTFLSKLKQLSQAINYNVSIIDEVTEYSFGTILPYCQLKKKDVFSELDKSKPLFTHVRGAIPPHVKPEIDLELLKQFPVVYSGDLHAHSNSQENIVYPGSPMTTSFHRTETKTGYLIIEYSGWNDEKFESNNWFWHEFNLPQLIRKTVSSQKEMVKTDYNHTIYELEGSIDSLSNIKDNELLDKKIVKRSSETALILDNSMSIEEELSEYFLYILELEEKLVKDLIGIYRDYTKPS